MKGAGISGSLGRQHIAQTVGKIVDVVEPGAVALLIGINQQCLADVGKFVCQVCCGGGLADTAL